jgi:Ca2+-transporting ATPase
MSTDVARPVAEPQNERASSERPSRAVAPPHAGHADEVFGKLGVDVERGLDEGEAARRLERDGPNELPPPPRPSPIRQFLAQFTNPIVLTLMGAAVIAIINGASRTDEPLLVRYGDATAILIIVALNAVLGFFQEQRAEAALDALQKMQTPHARVRRTGAVPAGQDGRRLQTEPPRRSSLPPPAPSSRDSLRASQNPGTPARTVSARELVAGDVLELEAGDAVPADARLLRSIDLAVLESSLTGEAAPIGKDAVAELPADTVLGDRTNMLFLGTQVVRGKGTAVVVATGERTELGKLSALINAPRDRSTPLEQKLEVFGHRILWTCLGLSALLFGWGMYRHERPWHQLLLEAVSLAVAAIPEGLPAITTITLALGMQRMARQGALVRKLAAVETLGSATVICTDKTGTLTQNQMTVREVYAGSRRFHVTGVGYGPEGEIVEQHEMELQPNLSPCRPLRNLLASAALCTNATLEQDESGVYRAIGDPTEAALLVLASKGGTPKESLAPGNKVVKELPFDSDRKRMTVVTQGPGGREVVHTKGSADVLLPLCDQVEEDHGIRPLDDATRSELLEVAEEMSSRALRVLAIARRRVQADQQGDLEQSLTFLGLVGMIDPPREGVKQAVLECVQASVRPVMITGDHKLTAVAIAQELGLWSDDALAFTGAEIEGMDEDALRKATVKARVFARVTAEQKLRIVRAFKSNGEIVAMTGDGVNDAPALREAHIGVAMGKEGTDVARQAADMVLADDNFATIVQAVHEGRAIYRNIQKSIFFLLSSNMGLLLTVIAVSLIPGLPPLAPLMILWINLVTNGLPALALGVDPPDPTQMHEPPRPRGEGLLGGREYLGIAVVGVWMGATALVCYFQPSGFSAMGTDPFAAARGRSIAFSLLALSPLFHAFNCRSPVASMLVLRPRLPLVLIAAVGISAAIHLVSVLVPGLRPLFSTFVLSAAEWTIMLGLAASIVPFVELGKLAQLVLTRMRGPGGPGAVNAAAVVLGCVGVALLGACAGSATTTGAPATRAQDPSIGELAARQGGLLGGGSGPRTEEAPAALRARTLTPTIDGAVSEWSELDEVTQPEMGSSPSTLAAGIAVDDTNLYVAGEVHDATPDPGDAVELDLQIPPSERNPRLALFVHLDGKRGRVERRTEAGGRITASPLAARVAVQQLDANGGASFEAAIPWSELGDGRTVRVGMRAALRYRDAAAGQPVAVVASFSGAAGAAPLPPLLIDVEASLVQDFLTPRNLVHATADMDLLADVAGDKLKERVLLYGPLLVVLGPHYREAPGKNGPAAFDWLDLGARVVHLDVRDATGDAKDDLLVLRQVTTTDEVTREAFEILAFTGDAPSSVFAHEVRIEHHGREVADFVHVGKGTVDVGPEKAVGWDAASFDVAPAASMDPILLPWTGSAETYRFDGKRFVRRPSR